MWVANQREPRQDNMTTLTRTSLEKHDFLREESLSSLPEGEWAAAEPQRGMMQRMRRVTARQAKEIEKENKTFCLIQLDV